MKKNLFNFSVLLIVLSSCQSEPEYVQVSGFAQGTTYAVTYENSIDKYLNKEVSQLLAEFDSSLSNYIPSSTISKINNNEDVIADSLFVDFFETSKKIYDISGGAFDISVGPIVNAWGFGWKSGNVPDSTQIDSLQQIIGFNKLSLVNGQLIKQDSRMQLVSNAIAQGQSVDIVSRYLEALGIKNYLVEIGGELKAKGVNANGVAWRIGIDRPDVLNVVESRQTQTVIEVNNQAVATSGNYRKFREINGKRFSHTINPATGYPVNHSLLSSTVIAPSCAEADALATAFMVLGLEQSMKILLDNPQYEAIFIYEDSEGALQIKDLRNQ